MSKELRSKIELSVQVVLAIAAITVVGVLVKRTFFPQKVNPASQPRFAVGQRLNGTNVDWAQHKNNLVFFLRKDCKYCRSIAPLYRQLIQDTANQKNIRLLAVLPDSKEEAKQYLQSVDLPIDDVLSSPLAVFQISWTPSVLLLDDQGIVKGAWIGADPSLQKQMRSEILALVDANVPPSSQAKQ
jgi:thiol-disulfide isomerase/thioredoxin